VLTRLRREPWRPAMLTVTVHNGSVDLWGLVDSEEQRSATRIATELTPGVQAVHDFLLLRPPTSGMA
jgi:osmotically-inducible protein OsmY